MSDVPKPIPSLGIRCMDVHTDRCQNESTTAGVNEC